jgi:hypothetical protein
MDACFVLRFCIDCCFCTWLAVQYLLGRRDMLNIAWIHTKKKSFSSLLKILHLKWLRFTILLHCHSMTRLAYTLSRERPGYSRLPCISRLIKAKPCLLCLSLLTCPSCAALGWQGHIMSIRYRAQRFLIYGIQPVLAGIKYACNLHHTSSHQILLLYKLINYLVMPTP